MKKIIICFFCFLKLFAFEDNEELISYLKNQIDLAVNFSETNTTNLPEEAFLLPGMSSKKNRILLNTLGAISKKVPTNYLEIGVWKGSTFIASNYGNPFLNSVGIDNWTGFGGPREDFFFNIRKFLTNNFTIIEADCFDLETLKSLEGRKFDIYFFDGHHSEEHQYSAFKLYDPLLSDVFIAIVDDWAWPDVKMGTHRAFNELRYQILYKFEIDSDQADQNGYWNGIFVALIKKQ